MESVIRITGGRSARGKLGYRESSSLHDPGVSLTPIGRIKPVRFHAFSEVFH